MEKYLISDILLEEVDNKQTLDIELSNITSTESGVTCDTALTLSENGMVVTSASAQNVPLIGSAGGAFKLVTLTAVNRLTSSKNIQGLPYYLEDINDIRTYKTVQAETTEEIKVLIPEGGGTQFNLSVGTTISIAGDIEKVSSSYCRIYGDGYVYFG